MREKVHNNGYILNVIVTESDDDFFISVSIISRTFVGILIQFEVDLIVFIIHLYMLLSIDTTNVRSEM